MVDLPLQDPMASLLLDFDEVSEGSKAAHIEPRSNRKLCLTFPPLHSIQDNTASSSPICHQRRAGKISRTLVEKLVKSLSPMSTQFDQMKVSWSIKTRKTWNELSTRLKDWIYEATSYELTLVHSIHLLLPHATTIEAAMVVVVVDMDNRDDMTTIKATLLEVPILLETTT